MMSPRGLLQTLVWVCLALNLVLGATVADAVWKLSRFRYHLFLTARNYQLHAFIGIASVAFLIGERTFQLFALSKFHIYDSTPNSSKYRSQVIHSQWILQSVFVSAVLTAYIVRAWIVHFTWHRQLAAYHSQHNAWFFPDLLAVAQTQTHKVPQSLDKLNYTQLQMHANASAQSEDRHSAENNSAAVIQTTLECACAGDDDDDVDNGQFEQLKPGNNEGDSGGKWKADDYYALAQLECAQIGIRELSAEPLLRTCHKQVAVNGTALCNESSERSECRCGKWRQPAEQWSQARVEQWIHWFDVNAKQYGSTQYMWNFGNAMAVSINTFLLLMSIVVESNAYHDTSTFHLTLVIFAVLLIVGFLALLHFVSVSKVGSAVNDDLFFKQEALWQINIFTIGTFVSGVLAIGCVLTFDSVVDNSHGSDWKNDDIVLMYYLLALTEVGALTIGAMALVGTRWLLRNCEAMIWSNALYHRYVQSEMQQLLENEEQKSTTSSNHSDTGDSNSHSTADAFNAESKCLVEMQAIDEKDTAEDIIGRRIGDECVKEVSELETCARSVRTRLLLTLAGLREDNSLLDDESFAVSVSALMRHFTREFSLDFFHFIVDVMAWKRQLRAKLQTTTDESDAEPYYGLFITVTPKIVGLLSEAPTKTLEHGIQIHDKYLAELRSQVCGAPFSVTEVLDSLQSASQDKDWQRGIQVFDKLLWFSLVTLEESLFRALVQTDKFPLVEAQHCH